MKKTISAVLVFILLISVVSFSSFAKEKDKKIVIELRSDIAGMTCEDFKDFALIRSDNIMFNETKNSDPIILTDCVGNIYSGEMKSGRTYTICYSFYASDDFEIPEKLTDENIELICGKGVNPYWYGRAEGADKEYALSVYTTVKVDGNFFQNFFGGIADVFLKIKSWSPY